MSRVALAALLGLGALAGCVPAPGGPYATGYPAAAPYYGGAYAPYDSGAYPAPYDGGAYAPYSGPTVIIGSERDDRERNLRYREDRDRNQRFEQRGRDQQYRDQQYRERGSVDRQNREQQNRDQQSRDQRSRDDRARSGPQIIGNRIENPQAFRPQPNPNPSTLPGAIPQQRNTIPIGGGP